jgi:hypothetical protein
MGVTIQPFDGGMYMAKNGWCSVVADMKDIQTIPVLSVTVCYESYSQN